MEPCTTAKGVSLLAAVTSQRMPGHTQGQVMDWLLQNNII